MANNIIHMAAYNEKLPDETPAVREQEDAVQFMGEMVARALKIEDRDLRLQLLGDLFFQVAVHGCATGAAAYYQPEAFGGLQEDAPDRNKDGTLKKTIRNFHLILKTAGVFGNVRFNTFTGSFEEDGKPWTDDDLSRSMGYIETYYSLKSREDFFHALNLWKRDIAYHPIAERMEAANWDGHDHISRFLPDVLGAADTAYNREVSRLLFHCGIARLMDPGCKADYMVILTGKQGSGKSTAVRFLAMDDRWYTELSDIRDEKAVGERLRGKWIVELGELSAFRASTEEIKSFTSRQSDRFRLAYDRLAQDFPRSCIFIGTTNNPRPLRDRTGNRRFLPVETGACAKDLFREEAAVREEIAQCWAQSLALWRAGDVRPYPSPLLLEQIEQRQTDTLEDDVRVGDIQRYLSDPNHDAKQVCIKQLWREALGELGNPTRRDSNFIAEVMDNMEGRKRSEKTIDYGQDRSQKCWFKTET